jgi:hypothetical protein
VRQNTFISDTNAFTQRTVSSLSPGPGSRVISTGPETFGHGVGVGVNVGVGSEVGVCVVVGEGDGDRASTVARFTLGGVPAQAVSPRSASGARHSIIHGSLLMCSRFFPTIFSSLWSMDLVVND